MLRQFARKLLADAAKTEPTGTTSVGTLSDISQLTTPLYGEIDGIGPVTLLADANMLGFSPVTKCVDSEHEIAWVPTDRILLTDPRVQPVGPTSRLSGSHR
jgi:hypothetical protein